MPTGSNGSFGLVIKGVGGETESSSLWLSKCTWLDIEEETTASNDSNFFSRKLNPMGKIKFHILGCSHI